MGQTVTILLRLLGYKDENVGGIWPYGYMAVAQTIGMTEGVSTEANAALTRGQAVRLFLNLLRADLRSGRTAALGASFAPDMERLVALAPDAVTV